MPERTKRRSPRLPRSERREQLLDVTRAIVALDGFHAVSIDRVAREAGISRPIVYEHFSDLAGLLRALLDRETARAVGQVAAFMPALGAGPAVREVLLGTLGAYLDAVASDPVTWRLMLMPPEGAPPFLRERVEKTRGDIVAVLTSLLEPDGGAFVTPDPPLLASSIEALAVHWSRLILTEPDTFDRDRILAGASWAIDKLAGS